MRQKKIGGSLYSVRDAALRLGYRAQGSQRHSICLFYEREKSEKSSNAISST